MARAEDPVDRLFQLVDRLPVLGDLPAAEYEPAVAADDLQILLRFLVKERLPAERLDGVAALRPVKRLRHSHVLERRGDLAVTARADPVGYLAGRNAGP